MSSGFFFPRGGFGRCGLDGWVMEGCEGGVIWIKGGKGLFSCSLIIHIFGFCFII